MANQCMDHDAAAEILMALNVSQRIFSSSRCADPLHAKKYYSARESVKVQSRASICLVAPQHKRNIPPSRRVLLPFQCHICHLNSSPGAAAAPKRRSETSDFNVAEGVGGKRHHAANVVEEDDDHSSAAFVPPASLFEGPGATLLSLQHVAVDLSPPPHARAGTRGHFTSSGSGDDGSGDDSDSNAGAEGSAGPTRGSGYSYMYSGGGGGGDSWDDNEDNIGDYDEDDDAEALNEGADGVGRPSGGKKARGSYACAKCGLPKRGHVCPFQPAGRAPGGRRDRRSAKGLVQGMVPEKFHFKSLPRRRAASSSSSSPPLKASQMRSTGSGSETAYVRRPISDVDPDTGRDSDSPVATDSTGSQCELGGSRWSARELYLDSQGFPESYSEGILFDPGCCLATVRTVTVSRPTPKSYVPRPPTTASCGAGPDPAPGLGGLGCLELVHFFGGAAGGLYSGLNSGDGLGCLGGGLGGGGTLSQLMDGSSAAALQALLAAQSQPPPPSQLALHLGGASTGGEPWASPAPGSLY